MKQMDIGAFKQLVESIELSEDTILAVSTIDDQALSDLAQRTYEIILFGPESINAGIGALLALMLEAAERRVQREAL